MEQVPDVLMVPNVRGQPLPGAAFYKLEAWRYGMKRSVLIAVGLVMLFAGDGLAQSWHGMMHDGMAADFPDDDGQYAYYMGPGMMGGYGMGPGMMSGYGMGPGMMGGYGMGPGMMGRYGMGPGMMGGYGMGYGWRRGVDPEVYRKFMDETAALRKKMHEKKFSYYEAARNPKTSREELYKMEKELYEMRNQLQEKARKAFQ